MDKDAIVVNSDYQIIQYESVRMAQEAFLDSYFGDSGFDRDVAMRMAGIEQKDISVWFTKSAFINKIEKRLQMTSKRRQSMQETLLEESSNIMEGNIVDLFDQTESGSLVVKNIKTLPRRITAAIKQMDVVRTSVPGRRAEFTECLRIVMHDKTKVMNIIGDYTDVKNTALKRVDSGAPKMVGFSLTTALPEQNGAENGEISDSGQVSDDGSTEGKAD
jgi:hypothetical protein